MIHSPTNQMTHHDAECAAMARPVGSGFRYACLSLPPKTLGAITAWRALDLTLRQITEQIAEPQVARSKLDWWRGALDDAVHRQQANHPILHALLAHSRADQQGALIAPIEARLGAALIALDYQGFATDADRAAYLLADGGALWQGYGILLDTPAHLLSALRNLGAASQRLDQLHYLGRHLARGEFPLPSTLQQSHGLSEADWLRPADHPAIDAALDAEWRNLLAQYRQAHADFRSLSSRPTPFFRSLLAQDRMRLRLIAPKVHQLRSERPEPSPFALLFTAWWGGKRSLPKGFFDKGF